MYAKQIYCILSAKRLRKKMRMKRTEFRKDDSRQIRANSLATDIKYDRRTIILGLGFLIGTFHPIQHNF